MCDCSRVAAPDMVLRVDDAPPKLSSPINKARPPENGELRTSSSVLSDRRAIPAMEVNHILRHEVEPKMMKRVEPEAASARRFEIEPMQLADAYVKPAPLHLAKALPMPINAARDVREPIALSSSIAADRAMPADTPLKVRCCRVK